MARLTDAPIQSAKVAGGLPYEGNQQFSGNPSSTRNCFGCKRFKPMAGGRIHPRKKQWHCAGCAGTWMPQK